MHSPSAIAVIAVLVWAQPVLGAQAPRIQPGARVRLDAPSLGGRLSGSLVAWDADTLVVQEDGQADGLRLIILADSVNNLEVHHERRKTMEGAGVGLLAGALVAVAASPDWVDENGDCTPLLCIAYKVSPNLDTRLTVWTLVGTVLGGIAGSGQKAHSWHRVPLRRLNVGRSPGGGLALGVSVSF